MALSKKSWLGIARETTPGVPAAAPTVYYPCKSVMKGTKKREQLKEERGTRDAIYGIVDTLRSGTTDPKGSYYNDTSPYLFLGALGSVSTTQPDPTNNPTVRQHVFTPADSPPTLTLFKSYDAAVYVAPYAAVEKLSLKLSADKLLELDASLQHLYPSKYTGSTLTPSFSALQPFAGYAPTIQLSSTASGDIIDVSIDFDQKLDLFYTVGGGQDFGTIYFGERSVTVSFTARFDDDSLYQRFLNRQDDSFTLTVTGPTISGTYKHQLTVTIPQISYDSMEHDLGKENVLIKAKATAIATVSSPLMTITVVNNTSGYTV